MRMVLPNLFGSYNNEPHRGLLTCTGKNPGGPETKSLMASGLTKITLSHGCTDETDTHIFAVADDVFSRAENEYMISNDIRFNRPYKIVYEVGSNSFNPEYQAFSISVADNNSRGKNNQKV
jgi:hypothetical protein